MESNNNQKKYKDKINKINTPDSLKNDTLNEMLKNKKNKSTKIKRNFVISMAAMFLVCFGVTNVYFDQLNIKNQHKINEIAVVDENQPTRFADMKELKDLLETVDVSNELKYEKALEASDQTKNDMALFESNKSHHTTNTQVEDVDESDNVKTDGKYIYTLNSKYINIVNAETFTLESAISFYESNKDFYPTDMYLQDDYLAIIGQEVLNLYDDNSTNTLENENISKDNDEIYYSNDIKEFTKVIVYNIKDRSNPYISTEKTLEGYNKTSRMINNNLYIITDKYIDNMDDEYGILPIYYDGTEKETIPVTDILYLDDKTNSTLKEMPNFTTIYAFDVTKDEELTYESYLGHSNTVYMNASNLYIAQDKISENDMIRTTIRKFDIDNLKINYKGSTIIDGSLNNQFSLDEYNGYLRVATTIKYRSASLFKEATGISEVHTTDEKEEKKSNNLYVLDENLNIAGSIENIAIDEEIKSVRFIEDIAYVVTFKEVDPLFVIDLSNPNNPTIKGELKIPGYSGYLHPYDDNHIIGIGYNTVTTSSDSIQNSTVKISMFDISDLNNPVELFNSSVAYGYKDESSYTEIQYDHKQLIYSKEKNLIGFPIDYHNDEDTKNGYALFYINMDENKFEYHDELLRSSSAFYYESMYRLIYIGNDFYEIFNNKIEKYNMSDFLMTDSLEIKFEN